MIDPNTLPTNPYSGFPNNFNSVGDGQADPTFVKLFNPFLNEAKRQADGASNPDAMKEAARQMETALVTYMLKTVEKSASESGLLGESSNQGMGYFKDEFLRNMAEEIVDQNELGFENSLRNTYGINELKP